MKHIKDIPLQELVDKRVLLRTDINAPIEDGKVRDDFRIRKGARTISYLVERGAKVVLLAHCSDAGATLEPIARALREYVPLTFVADVTGQSARAAVAALSGGSVLLLENVRHDPREEANDMGFAKELAGFGDLFVNDAFAVSHRDHASVVGVPQLLPSYAGFQLADEVEALERALSPKHPALCILGGAKFATKEPLVEKFLESYDHVFIGGAIANDFFKAQGYEVGRSRVSSETPSQELIENTKLIIPTDVIVERRDGQARVCQTSEVREDEKILDIGPDSVCAIAPLVKDAKLILWNGPMGYYEGGYDAQTLLFARLVAASDAYSIVGGGDTIAAITEQELEESFGFISTGGGAMLEFLEKGTLPGIEALG